MNDITNIKIGLKSLNNNKYNYDHGIVDGNNVAIGYKSLENNFKGFQNTAIGSLSLSNNGTSHNNTCVGFKSLNNSIGKYNTALGALSGKNLVDGKSNILLGKEADVGKLNAYNQIVIGTNAIGIDDNSVTLGNNYTEDIYMSQEKNAIIHCGGLNLYNDDGNFIYSFPNKDGNKNNVLISDGSGNLRWSDNNILSNLSINNIEECTINLSKKNMFIGINIAKNNIINDNNTDYRGTRNTAFGIDAFVENTTGKNNTCFGSDTLIKNKNGNYNSAFGYNSLKKVISGNNNIGVGYNSGNLITNGNNNICIGNNTNVSNNKGENQIIIGNNINSKINNSITLGNKNVTNVFMGENSNARINCTGIKPNLKEATSDYEAKTVGVEVGELYNNSGTIKVRLI